MAPICVLPPSGGSTGSCNTCITAGSATTCTGSGQGNCCSGLTCSGGTCTALAPTVTTICSTGQFDEVARLAGIATLAMAALVAVAYMGGELMQNPRLLTWAKSEALQVFVSLVIALVILWFLSIFCHIEVSEVGAIPGVSLPAIFGGIHSSENLYNGALLYIENLGAAGLANLASIRYNIAAYEIRTSYNVYTCDHICLFSLSSTNVALFGGETMMLAINNNLLSLATIGQLSILFQYFALLFIVKGLFVQFLPLAIVMRSIPFMREFGGALIGIFVALYLLYPAMLVADAFILPGFINHIPGGVDFIQRGTLCGGTGIFGTGLTCLSDTENEANIQDAAGTSESSMNNIAASDPSQTIRFNALIFLASIFLPAINFVVIAALGRDLSHFLGEESDISRLGQMV